MQRDIDDEQEAEVRSRVLRLLDEFRDAGEREFLGAQFDAGLTRIEYPPGCGGLGMEPKLQQVIEEMLAAAGRRVPWTRNPMGIGMCSPTIVAFGTAEQKARHLRPIHTSDELWCQLFSEPDAGSDVASLSTRAVRDGGDWVVNGQKVWTSLAHEADFGLLIARTDPTVAKHKGLTAFILDMHVPGVQVRGLRKITGVSDWFNEVFLDDVRIPDSSRLGPVGEGWKVATATLMNERVAIGGELRGRGEGPIAAALEAWAAQQEHDPVRRDQLVKLWVSAEVLRLGAIRAQSLREQGVPGPEGSFLKLSYAMLRQQIAEFVVNLIGANGMLVWGYGPGAPFGEDPVLDFEDPVLTYLGVQCTTIAGGTSEIMRNILGERVLGLPREPGPDPGTPWNEIPRSVS
ncbi:acyl-CoA dehydrogenase family protein [Trebonia sp.]|uniref:acyl-CoA dehydrogenase family protein n=1 Tax=Trebonia sp. TaxID=2767075 RepID=UPI00260708F7|nr:acyl-CoA dehydrogenase family protein [Trebonia sp.]